MNGSVRMVFSAFKRDSRGAFATMFALLLTVLVMAVGLAIDYTRLQDYRVKLEAAADSAVLAAIVEKSAGMTYAESMAGVGDIPPGVEDSRDFFEANFIGDGWVTVASVAPDVRKEKDRIYSALNYEADVGLLLGGFFGMKTIRISGHAEAEIRTDPNIDFYLLLDNSPSMGLGATEDDIATLMDNTSDKCAFACHATSDNHNYYNLAKDLGVEMRIDVVRQATKKLTKTAKDLRKNANQYRMAVYSFGEKAETMGLTLVAELSGKMKNVRESTDALDLMSIPYQNYDNDQQTDFDNTIAAMNAVIPDPGSGLAGAEPQKVLFFVSDGVNDSEKLNCTKMKTGNRCQEPIDTAVCDAVKDRGIKIAVLYTTYLPLPSNSWYNTWIKPFQSEIATRMRDCASTGLYFEVSPSEGIAEAMDALFLKTISVLHITS